jgi:hypothetical protein
MAVPLNSLDYNIIMERFYDPRRGQESTPIPNNYDPRVDAGSSGGETSDLNPGRAYKTDTRHFSGEARTTAGKAGTNNTGTETRVNRYLAAAKTAGKFKQQALIDEPQIRGRTPRTEANIKGTNVPTLGDRIGIGGSTNYATKPTNSTGKFVSFQ